MNSSTTEYAFAVEDSFQASLVKGASFTKDEEYPIIPSDWVSKKLPESIMPFNKALNHRGDLSKTFVCFYSPDKSFERIRRNPERYVSFLRKTGGIIGPDFSIHSDMPVVKQKSQMNDNLSLTYYYGSQGIPVIPNLRVGIDELEPEFFSAIPKRTYVAVGTHGFIKEKQEQFEWFCFLEKITNEICPKGIIVYGSLNGKLFDGLKERTDFFFYEPWINQRLKEVKSDGNKGTEQSLW
ncbi:MAG: DUF4417 domain-containing protein [Clostridia bacterium]|nr:DUF4417 domain-containing protein [Clostridia bacterium]